MDQAKRLKKMKVSDLVPFEGNPRQITTENLDRLEQGIDEFGMVQPIIWNTRTKQVVGGHQRLAVLKRKEVKETWVIEVDMDEEREAALNIALNNPRLMGEFDLPGLASILEQFGGIESNDFGGIAGFDHDEVRDLLGNLEPDKPPTDDVDEVVEDVQLIIKLGDVVELGDHRVVCGDAAEVIGMAMDGEKYQLIVTDPPYGVSYADKNEFLNAIDKGNRIQDPIEFDHQTPEEMEKLWTAVFSACRKYAEAGASYYSTGPQGGDLLLLLLHSLRNSGFPLRHTLIWAKNVHVLGRSDYNYKHEPIIFGWVEGTHYFNTDHTETSLWEIPKPSSSKLHPTMKPIELCARAIRNSSRVGDTVLDPFLGSGSTLLAAEHLKRKCYGIEIDPKYVQVIIQRWLEYTERTNVIINGEAMVWPKSN